MRCEVQHDYASFRDGSRYAWTKGEVVELDPDVVEWISVDSPGALKVVADRDEPTEPESTDESVQGVEVSGEEAEFAGAGEAVNAETGEVTAPGEPLPPINAEDEPAGSKGLAGRGKRSGGQK